MRARPSLPARRGATTARFGALAGFLAAALMEQGKLDGGVAPLRAPVWTSRSTVRACAHLPDSRARLRLLRGDLAGGLEEMLEAGRRFEGLGAATLPSWPGARRRRSRCSSWASGRRPRRSPRRSSSWRAPGVPRGRSAPPCASRAWSRVDSKGSPCWRRRSRCSPTRPRSSSTQGAHRAGSGASPRQPTLRGTRAASARRRAGHDLRRGAARRTRRDRASRHRCATSTDCPERRRLAHAQRAARRGDGGRGSHEP